MPRSRLSLVLLVLPLAVACGQRDVPISAEPARAPVVETRTTAAPPDRQGAPPSADQGLPQATNGVLPPGAADKIMAPNAAPIVKLLDGGAAPRSELSYALSKGPSPRLSMAMDMTIGAKAAGQSQPATTFPRMTMVFDIKGTDKNPAGEVSIDSRLTSLSVDPNGGQQEQLARALRPQIEGLKGLGMLYWVNPKGRVRDVKIDMPPGVPPGAQQLLGGMSQSIESMVTPLPNEAVGVGARWQVTSRTLSGGADLLQAAVYTLRSRTASKAVLDITLVQLAASDTIHSPQMPAGMAVKVKSFSSGGSGSTQLDLKSISPEGGSMTLKNSMTIAVQGGGPDTAGDSTVDNVTSVTMGRP